MKIFLLIKWLFSGVLIITMAFMISSKVGHASEMPEEPFYGDAKEPELDQVDTLNLEILRKQNERGLGALSGTTVNSKGQIVFTYGSQMPAIICSILQITDLELEAGEVINSVNLGDSARWSVEPAISGSENGEVQHILIKPLDIALETSMVITTDKRTYRLKLKSTEREYFPSVAFSYPENLRKQFEAQQALVQKEREEHSIDTGLNANGAKTYLGDLNFKYKIEGNVSWRPIRVFDDGHKTVIEMPEHMLARTAPSLLILEDEGGFFSDEKTSIINYRLQGTRYVVDGLFDTAILTLDVGDDQQRVIITREGGI